MKVLVLGKGGREHALAYALSHSPAIESILAVPGNPGIAQLGTVFPEMSPLDPVAIGSLCREHRVDFVVVGPEDPLAHGITDALERMGIPVFGPSQAAAQLEASKAFAKTVMQAAGIPTANYQVFESGQLSAAVEFAASLHFPVVIKADGLAAGKGVVLAENLSEAERTLQEFFGGKFGSASQRVVVEEFLSGFEASVFAITDGTHYLLLAPAQDHKRAYEGDQGPNTGGMGAYAPTPLVDAALLRKVETRIVQPVLAHMRQRGTPYKGCLYCGLMIVEGEPYVLEFNVRFGDPEAQVVLPIIDGDIAALLYSAASGELDPTTVQTVQQQYACCVVLASQGYPGAVEIGKRIAGVEAAEAMGALVFHAGTKVGDNGALYTAGGRVLGVTGLGSSLEAARNQAYEAAERIHFEGKWYRNDIAWQALRMS